MQRYEELHQKLVNKTITEAETTELFQLAFGEEFMSSETKGELVEY